MLFPMDLIYGISANCRSTDRHTHTHIYFFDPRQTGQTVYFPSQITSNRVDINLSIRWIYVFLRRLVLDQHSPSFERVYHFGGARAKTILSPKQSASPRKLSARVSSACISGSLHCLLETSRKKYFRRYIVCASGHEQRFLTSDILARCVHRRWIGSSFLFPHRSLSPKQSGKWQGVSRDPANNEILYRVLYDSSKVLFRDSVVVLDILQSIECSSDVNSFGR